MPDPLLKVRNISKRFGERYAVRSVSFEVSRGEVFGLLGPNGAGKTTLLSVIAGIIAPDEGEVALDGLNPSSPEARSMIGYSPQEPVVYEDLTGFENLMFYAGLHGLTGSEARRRCRELLELMGLSDYANRLVRTYSGGMKKKLSFAAALIGDPKLLILDEPTTGMDPGARRDVWKLITGKGDRAVILATHYMEEADALSNRVAIMHEGEIVAEGSPEELKRRYGPRAVISVKLLEHRDEVLELLRPLASEGRIARGDGEVRVHVEDPDEAAPEIVSKLLERGYKLESLRIARPTLEDVFLRLTGRRLSGE